MTERTPRVSDAGEWNGLAQRGAGWAEGKSAHGQVRLISFNFSFSGFHFLFDLQFQTQIQVKI
jgi:hypothetical protein